MSSAKNFFIKIILKYVVVSVAAKMSVKFRESTRKNGKMVRIHEKFNFSGFLSIRALGFFSY